ncbi:MAG TPA: selenocysteine-specific translation elongation factor [Chthoniobacterales bacterium]|jgi:selenocysteine-specific elongation factor|nr:selenocysteine-specific translation elongation factor [Chthoniobacterales bacterium]
MREEHFILATAGHVDHGKSALVKALTGTDPDRLPEEKARGITIDLGFANLQLPAPRSTLNPQLSTYSVGIVDVPGHEDFVRNMIAGVGSIDLALLVVAADDGWMPQTEEHFQILLYLGAKRIVVALTKSDLGNTENVTTQIREQLNDSPFAHSQIIPTSVRTDEGLEDLKRTLSSELANLPPPRDIGKPRLFVDRAFMLRGIGTVVTGTLTGGQLSRGQNVVIQPQNLSTRIRSIQSHGRDLEIAHPGTRTAVNLPDLVLDRDVQRGNVIAAVGYEPTSTLDVLLTRSPRLQRSAAIKSGTSAYVHYGTTRVLGKMIFAETDSLAAGASAVAQLRLGAPLLAFVGDRLIVRDASGQHTIAGGVVFNVDSNPKDFRQTQESTRLASRAIAPGDIDLAVWTEFARSGVIEPSRLLERSHFSAAEIATALRRLCDHGEIFLSDNVGAKMLVWLDLRERTARIIDTAHRTHPERRGLELSELRAELTSISPAVFDALMIDLCQTDFVRTGSTIARGSHRSSLPPDLKAAAEKVRAALSAKPFDPPARETIATKNDATLRFLIDNGEIVEVAPEVVLLRENFEQMKAQVVELISTNGPATASQLRAKLGSSRRVIIPFLEYLDRVGVTQRVGDSRQLRETKSAAVARR